MAEDITPAELASMFSKNEDFVLIDVREEWEIRISSIDKPQTYILPLSLISKNGYSVLPEKIFESGIRIVIICHLGERSLIVANWLSKIGIPNVYNLAGGIHRYAIEIDASISLY